MNKEGVVNYIFEQLYLQLNNTDLISVFGIEKLNNEEITQVRLTVQSKISEIHDKFYETLITDPESKPIFEKHDIEKLKVLTLDTFINIISDKIDRKHIINKFKIGNKHYRIGISPVMYMKYLNILEEIITGYLRPELRVIVYKFMNLERFLTIYSYNMSEKIELKDLKIRHEKITKTMIHDVNNPLTILLPYISQNRKQLEKIEKAAMDIYKVTRRTSMELEPLLHNIEK